MALPFELDPPLEVIVVAADGEKLEALNSGELKNSRQVVSTEFGSAMYFSYISSTSQSLAPKFPLTEGKPIGAHQGVRPKIARRALAELARHTSRYGARHY